MIDAERLKGMASNSAGEDGCLREYVNASADLRQVGSPGKMTAGDAFRIFSLRARHARDAGIAVSGMERALQSLSELDENEPLLLFHFTGDSRTFTIFVSAEDECLIGCLAVPSRRAI
jgi:hypothetical protein